MALCTYEREPIGVDGALEAVSVFYYCSQECREAAPHEDSDIDGESELTMDGLQCERCGKLLD